MIAVPNEVEGLKFRLKRLSAALGLSRAPRWSGPITLDARTTEEVHLSHFTVRALKRLLRRCGFHRFRDTPDRHYVSTGLRRLCDDLFYAACWTARRLLWLGIYDTLLVTAQKPS